MENCKAQETPMQVKVKLSTDDDIAKVNEILYRSLIGCLMYLSASRPDIVQAVSLLSRFMHCASEEHMQAAKRILKYVKGTVDYGIKYARSDQFQLIGFSDIDYRGSVDDVKITSGFCFALGSGMIS